MFQVFLDKTTSWMAESISVFAEVGREWADWNRDLSIGKAVLSAALQMCYFIILITVSLCP